MTQVRRVAIIHPWMPIYRVAVFEKLIALGRDRDIEITVFYGTVPPEWNSRRDHTDPDFAVKLRTRFLRWGSQTLVRKSLREVRAHGPWDLIIFEQAIRNLETYCYLMQHPRGRVAFWGHGKTYTKDTPRILEWLKQRLTRRGEWFFAYTPGGAAAVKGAGFPEGRITVVWNALEKPNSNTRAPGRDTDHTVLVLGGLDESKRIPFLLEALDTAREKAIDMDVVFAGEGHEKPVVEQFARSRPWVRVVGRADGEKKARLLASATLIANPGRVGLVAVDSLAWCVPIVTTRWPYHAPEFEYLTDGVNAVVSGDTVPEFAHCLVSILHDERRRQGLVKGCADSAEHLTVDGMAERFIAGVESALAVSDQRE